VSDTKYGPNTAQVEAVLSEISSWTVGEAKIAFDAFDAGCDVAIYVALGAACHAAVDAGRGEAWDAAWDAACDVACDVAWNAAYNAGRVAAYNAGRDTGVSAAVCAVVSDLISEEHQEVLNVGVEAVREHRVKKENASAHGDTRRRELAEWARKRAKKARKKAERSGERCTSMSVRTFLKKLLMHCRGARYDYSMPLVLVPHKPAVRELRKLRTRRLPRVRKRLPNVRRTRERSFL
jgi:hypothetical protein